MLDVWKVLRNGNLGDVCLSKSLFVEESQSAWQLDACERRSLECGVAYSEQSFRKLDACEVRASESTSANAEAALLNFNAAYACDRGEVEHLVL